MILVHLFFFLPSLPPPFPSRPFPSRAAPLPTPPCGSLDRGLASAASRRGAPQCEGRDRGITSRGRSRLPRAEILGRGLARRRRPAWSYPTRGSIHRFHDDVEVALGGQRGGRWRRGLRLGWDSKAGTRGHQSRQIPTASSSQTPS
jgi:hypothetical protein